MVKRIVNPPKSPSELRILNPPARPRQLPARDAFTRSKAYKVYVAICYLLAIATLWNADLHFLLKVVLVVFSPLLIPIGVAIGLLVALFK